MVRKLLIALLLLFIAGGYSYAACTADGSNWASSADLSSVSTCVSNADRGDIITITGSATWDSGLTITKAVTLVGNGATITSNRSSTALKLVYISPSSPASDSGYVYQISGITWALNSKSGWLDIENDTVTAGVVPDAINIRVNNNTVTGAIRNNVDARTIDVNGMVYGVFDNNSITGQVYIEIDGLNSGDNPGKDDWNNRTWSMGSGDALYFENNTITYQTASYEPSHQIFTSSGGGRYVARYNTIDTAAYYGWKQVFDIHGNENGVRGSFGAELYGNKIISASDYTLELVQYMGGKGAMFMNWVSTSGTYGIGTAGVKERVIDNLTYSATPDPDSQPTTTNYECPTGESYLYPETSSCTSDGQPQHVWRVYTWKNRYGAPTGSAIAMAYSNDKYYPNSTWESLVGGTLVESYHFFDDNDVSAGPTVPTGSCTIGQAQWVSTDTYNDLTDYTGVNHASNISGTLYRCSDTDTWTEYYSPYTYPHPLRTITAASCSYADVNSAVMMASRGDTVNVPAGTCSWGTNELTVNKAISLIGAGVGNTNISTTREANGTDITAAMIKYQNSSSSSDANILFRVSGFTFDLNYSTQGVNLAQDYTGKVTPVRLTKNRIDNNTFLKCPKAYGYDGGAAIYANGHYYGVIDHNSFSGSPSFIFNGVNVYAWNNYTYDLGSGNTWFLEDNSITYDTAAPWTTAHGQGNAITVSQGSHATVRYNTITVNDLGYDWWLAWNMHGNAYSVYSAMGSEFYGNIVDPPDTKAGQAFLLRGGKNVAFYNRILTNGTAYEQVTEESADTTSPTNYTCPSETLYAGSKACNSAGNPQHVNKTYIWNNRRGTSGVGTVERIVNYESGTLAENVYYWKDYGASCSGDTCSSGVGCGTLLPTYCTTGTGFWITENSGSCGDLTNLVGASHSSNISGILYRCYPTNIWTAYYTPYTYPHPLTGGSDKTPPVMSSPCTGIETCISPITEIACTDESEPYTMDVLVGLSTSKNATVKYNADRTNAEYDSMDSTMTGAGGTTHTTTLTGLACGASYSLYTQARDAASNTTTETSPIISFSIAPKSATIPTLTNLSETHQAYSPRGQLIKVQSSIPASCRYTTVAAITQWEDRTPFGMTGDTIFPQTNIPQAPSTSVTYHVLCRGTQGGESANLPITVTTYGRYTASVGTGVTISVDDSVETAIDF